MGYTPHSHLFFLLSPKVPSCTHWMRMYVNLQCGDYITDWLCYVIIILLRVLFWWDNQQSENVPQEGIIMCESTDQFFVAIAGRDHTMVDSVYQGWKICLSKNIQVKKRKIFKWKEDSSHQGFRETFFLPAVALDILILVFIGYL